MTEELLVLNTLGGGTFAPQSEAGWFERFSHVGNYLALGKASDFADFLKGDPVGPGSPDDPIRTILRGLGFFDPGNWTVGLFGLHQNIKSNFI
jgi:hypothetical protein